MSDPAIALEATRENFPQLVLENSRKGPVLVDFWAPWVGPSQRQREVLLRLAREYAGRFLLVTVDTDREKEIARELGVRSLPSCKLFRNGQTVDQVHGVQSEADYRELIERHIVSLAGKAQAAALKAWHSGDREKALQVLAEAAMSVPDDPALPLLLAKLLVQDQRHKDACLVLRALPESVRRHPEIQRLHTRLELVLAAHEAPPQARLEAVLKGDPGDSEAHFSLAALHLTDDDQDAALEHLAELQRCDPDYRRGLPRLALAVVLETLDPADPRVRRYRRALFEH